MRNYIFRNRGKESEYENMDSDMDDPKLAFKPNRSESEQREIDEFEEEERKILMSQQDSQLSSGLAFAIPGRWTGGKREVRPRGPKIFLSN